MGSQRGLRRAGARRRRSRCGRGSYRESQRSNQSKGRAGHLPERREGFCVVRVKARGHRELVTLVGHAAAISAGEWITASGNWINDRTHGQQFKAQFLRASAPTSVEGIEKYLASGMIRGIGPVFVTGVGVLANPRSRLSLIIREPFPGHPLIRRLTRE